MNMTRKEAIGRIQEHIHIHSKKEPFTPYLDKAFDMAIEALKEQRPHGEWILCSERLPEEYNSYLVTKLDTYPNGSTFTTLAYFYTEETGWDIDGVIAWMPFPKPYKKEGEAECRN